MPKVSVIVPIYNVEDYLERCLSSLENQTLDDIELILVDDGSSDSSYEIMKKFANESSKKVTLLHKENGGLSDARNYAIPYANGEYIAFLDSDDYVENEMYEKMYKKAKDEDADFVECDFYWEYPKKQKEDIRIYL